MYQQWKTKLTRVLTVLLTTALLITAFTAAATKAADGSDDVIEIRLNSSLTSITEGPLPAPRSYVSLPKDANYKIYGSAYWYEYSSNAWDSYSTQYHVAIADNKTHYGLYVEFELPDVNGQINFYLNDVLYNDVGYSQVYKIYKNYVSIIFDLGVAAPRNIDPSLPNLQNVSLNGNDLSWDPIEGASYYFITIANTMDGRVYGGFTKATTINLCAMLRHPDNDTDYIVGVNAFDEHIQRGGKVISQMWTGFYHSPEYTGKNPYTDFKGDIKRELQDDSKPDLYHYNMVLEGDYASIPASSMHILYRYFYNDDGFSYYSDNTSLSFYATPDADLWVDCSIYIDGVDYDWYVSMAIHQDNGDINGYIAITGDAVPESTLSAQVTNLDIAFPENLVYTWQIRDDKYDSWKVIQEKTGSSELYIDFAYEAKELRLIVTYPEVFTGSLESDIIKVKYHPSRVFPIEFIVYENGYAAISAKEATAGTQIIVAATPCIGYEVEAIWYRPAGGKSVNIASDPVFFMPVEGATVKVTFRPKTAASGPSFAEFIERLYNVALARDSEPEGKAFWLNKVLNEGFTGADCARGFLIQSPEFGNRGLNDDQFLRTLYKTFFDRDPDDEGYSFWMQKISEGMTREQIIEGFIDATEWCNLCAHYGVKSGAKNFQATVPSNNAVNFASRLYICCLNRVPDNDGLNFWALRLTNLESSGYEAARDFFQSIEFGNLNTSDEEFVTRLYRTFMGREPDDGGFAFWINHLKTDMDRASVIAGFAQSQEFTNICNEYGITRGGIQ